MPVNGLVGFPPDGGLQYGSGVLTATTSSAYVNLGSLPLANTEHIVVNGRFLVPSLDYTMTGATARLFVDLFAGDVVYVRWATRAPSPGTISLGSASPYSLAILADSPWGWWRFAEASGATSLADSSGNSRPMSTVVGSLASVTGPKGKGLTFPVSAAAYTAATSAGPSTASSKIWFYFTGNPSAKTALTGLHVSAGSTGDKDIYLGTDGKINWYWFDGTARTITSTSAVSGVGWHMVDATVGPAGTFLYLDGVQVATHASTTSYTGSAMVVNARYGTDSGNSLYTGDAISLAEAAFFTTQLSAARIAAHYAA